MFAFPHRLRRLLALLTAVVALTAAAPAAANPTNPNPDATWAAWGMSVTFPSGNLRVQFAAYVGKDDPDPLVLDDLTVNITGNCTIQDGPLQVDANGYAKFNGSAYIECTTPDWSAMVYQLAPHLPMGHLSTCECSGTKSLFWTSADVIVDAVSAENPAFVASDVGYVGLPSNGSGIVRTRVLRNGEFLSPAWTVNTAIGNRMIVGQNGPKVVASTSYFGGLPYLTDPRWVDYFENDIGGTEMGQWLEPQLTRWDRVMPPAGFNMPTGSMTVYIGYNPNTGAALNGKLRTLRVDPGCFGS